MTLFPALFLLIHMVYLTNTEMSHIPNESIIFLFGEHLTARENKLEAFCQCFVSHAATGSLFFFSLWKWPRTVPVKALHKGEKNQKQTWD